MCNRRLARAGSYSFTDVLIAGSTIVKRIHLIELRLALEEARNKMPVPALSYTQPSITAGSTIVMAADINDLRNGVK